MGTILDCAENNFGRLRWVTYQEYSNTFKRGAPRLEASPRFVGVYSYTSQHLTTITNAHTHTHMHANIIFNY